MVAPYNPPKKGEDFICFVTLEDATSPGNFRVNPTVAAGDFKISKDDGSLADLATTPTVSPANSCWVKLTLSATEMTADNVKVQGIDQSSPKQWSDFSLNIVTTQ